MNSNHQWQAGDRAVRVRTNTRLGETTEQYTTCFPDDCDNIVHRGQGLHWHHDSGGWDPLLAQEHSGFYTIEYRPQRTVTINVDNDEEINALVDRYIEAAQRLGHPFTQVRREHIIARMREALLPAPEPCRFFAAIGGVQQQCSLTGPHDAHQIGTWTLTEGVTGVSA
jgi:hypothetical protein